MSQYTRLSIWENNPQGLNWYDHLVGRKTPATPFITPNTELHLKAEQPQRCPDQSSSHELAYQDVWFNELMRQDREKARAKKERAARALLETKPVGSGRKNLPLNPYFEYMFADAELSSKSSYSQNNVEHVSFQKDTHGNDASDVVYQSTNASSPPEWQPRTPESARQSVNMLTLNEVNANEVVVLESTKFLEDIEAIIAVAELGDTKDQSKKAYPLNANIGKNTEALSFSDITTTYTDTVEKQEPQNFSFIFTNGNPQPHTQFNQAHQRHVLKPTSPRARSRNTTTTSARHTTLDTSNALAQVGKKRPADELWSDKPDPKVHDVEYSCNKKAKITLDEQVCKDDGMEVDDMESVVCESVTSDERTSQDATKDFFNHKPLIIAPKGYAGQFDGMVIKHTNVADFKYNLTAVDKVKTNVHHTFGNRRHPNGTYTHTSITFDLHTNRPDFTKENLPASHPLHTCIEFANDMTDAASHMDVAKLRNYDEEILRREAHIECASARLEGIAVGFYRYYQGHLSIEEYHQAEMCIC